MVIRRTDFVLDLIDASIEAVERRSSKVWPDEY